jgi:hypothetical protein
MLLPAGKEFGKMGRKIAIVKKNPRASIHGGIRLSLGFCWVSKF